MTVQSDDTSLGRGTQIALGVAAAVSVLTLAFAPGIGCGQTSSEDAARQVKLNAIGRHKFEAVSSFLETQKRIARKKRAQEAKQAEENAKTTKDPLQLTTFRTGVVVAAWKQYFQQVFPTSQVNGGHLTPDQAKTTTAALQALDLRLQALSESATAAKLPDVATAAETAREGIPALVADAKDATLPAFDYKRMDKLIKDLRSASADAGLKLLPRVPIDFLSSGRS